jgi:transposase
MRGNDAVAGSLFSYVDVEKRVRAAHPLRVIREIVNATLKAMSAEFDALYSPVGRESIPPERLLRALLLQAFYSIRSERQLVERIEFDLLFRWFVGLGVDDPVWDATTFTKNRDRLLEGDIAARFLAAVLAQPRVKALLSGEHFSVDGTLLEAWASTKSFRPKDGSGPPADPGRNGEQDFRGQKRGNETHASTTDGDARLYRKGRGKEAKLCFMGHALMENRNGLIVGAVATRASGHAERLAALHLIEPHAGRAQRVTVGADKGFDAQDLASMPRTSSTICARATSPRTWRGTSAAGARRSTAGRRAIPATRSACASASASRRRSAGPRRWPGCARRDIADCPRSTGSSPSPWPPTTSSACQNCSELRHDTRTPSGTTCWRQKYSRRTVPSGTHAIISRAMTPTNDQSHAFSAAC